MNTIERSQSIIPQRRVSLNDAQRAFYKETIKPFIEAAKEAYQPMFQIREQLRFLDSEQERIENQIDANPAIQGRHPFSAALTGIKLARAALEQTPISKEWEAFRLKANELVSGVNSLKAGFAVANGLIQVGETSLVGQPQISPIEPKNKFLKPDSPIRPHNDLGTLGIYRSKQLDFPLTVSIRVAFQEAVVKNQDVKLSANAPVAVLTLVPLHLLQKARSNEGFRKELASDVVDIAYSVGKYDAGLLEPPSVEELGLRGPEQDEYISTHLKSLLAHYLRVELITPNMKEKEIQDLYQKLSNFIRGTARFITAPHENITSSLDRIGHIMENLPGLEGPMLSTRLSTNLYMDLGLPCLDFASELRIAEILRNLGNSGYWVKDDIYTMQAGGYIIPEERRFRLEKILDSIVTRMESNEFDCQKLFEALESVYYGEQVIENIFAAVDEDQQDILLMALVETSCFADLKKKLVRRRNAFEWDDTDVMES